MRRRAGMALLAALALMTLIALLVVGALTSSTLAERSSRASGADARLSAAADYAAYSMLANAQAVGLADLPLGQPVTTAVSIPDGRGIVAEVTSTRLRGGVLWLVADASLAGVDAGHRRINVVARFPWIGNSPGSAVVSRGGVRVEPGAVFLPDTSHSADCPDPSVDILVPLGTTTAGADSLRVVHQQSAADSVVYYLTNVQLALLDDAGRIRHVHGDTVIGGGSFDGVLIVDGALTIAGPFTATGLLIARGIIDARAGPLALTGALLSFAAPLGGAPAIEIGPATIRYSGCVVTRVLREALLPRTAKQRGWAELF